MYVVITLNFELLHSKSTTVIRLPVYVGPSRLLSLDFEKMTQEEQRRPRVYLNWSHFTKQHYTLPSRALTSKIIVLSLEQRGRKPQF